MTSQKSSVNKKAASYDLKRALKQALLPSLFSLIAYLLTFAAGAKNCISMLGEDLLKQIPEGFDIAYFTPDWAGTGIICLITGVMFALTGFYIMNKASVNFHLSLPIDRKTLFKNRFIASTAMIFCTLFIGILVAFMINVHYFGNAAWLLKMALSVFFEAFIYAMAGYVIMSIAIFSCYTVIEGLIFGAALIALPTVIITAFSTICQAFLNGYARNLGIFDLIVWGDSYSTTYNSVALIILLAVANPLLLGYISLDGNGVSDIFELSRNTNLLYGMQYDIYDRPDYENWLAQNNASILPDAKYFVPLVMWVAILIALALLAKTVFVNRKAEKTSIHASNPVATHLFATEAAVVASFFLVYFFAEVSSAELSVPLAIILYAVSFALAELIVTAVSKRQFIFKNKRAYAVTAVGTACVTVLMAVLATGGLGYTSYAPKAEDIDCAIITNADLGDVTGGIAYDDTGLYPGLGYAFNGLTVVKGDDIKTLLEAKDEIVKGYTTSGDVERVNIVYLTKDGKIIKREYRADRKTVVDATLKIMNTPSYTDKVKSIICAEDLSEFQTDVEKLGFDFSEFISNPYGDDEESFNDFANDVFKNGEVKMSYFGYNTSFDVENTPALRKALAEDIASIPAEKRLRPGEDEICRLTFSAKDSVEYESVDGYEEAASVEDEYYYYNSQRYIIYPSMTRTLSYLGNLAVPDTEPDTVECAYVTTLNDYQDKAYLTSDVFSGFEVTEDNYSQYYDDVDKDVYALLADNRFESEKITDKAELKRLASVSKTYALLERDDYLVAYLVKTSGGTHKIRYMCIYKENYK